MSYHEKKTRILTVAGSARRDSYNKHLIRSGLRGEGPWGRGHAASIRAIIRCPYTTVISRHLLGFRKRIGRSKKLMRFHHSFLIACPTYNSYITATLKTTIALHLPAG